MSPVFGEPTLAIREVQDDPLDAPPESGTVVGFHEVDLLVDDHVLHHTGREAEGAPVEVEVPPGRKSPSDARTESARLEDCSEPPRWARRCLLYTNFLELR